MWDTFFLGRVPLSPNISTTTREDFFRSTLSSRLQHPHPTSNSYFEAARRPSTTWEIDVHALSKLSVAAETTLLGQSAVLRLHMSEFMRRRSRPLLCQAGSGPRGQPRPSGMLKNDLFKARKSALSEGEMWMRLPHQQIMDDKSTTSLIGTDTTGKILGCHPYHAFSRLPTADTTMLDIGPQNVSSCKPPGHVSNVQMLTLGPVWKHAGCVTKKPTLVRAVWLVTVRFLC